jgi:Flp pilus assembly protein TadD
VVLLHALGKLLERQGRARLPEAIECYRAIRARHRNLGVTLAMALVLADRKPEADAVMRDLVRQQPGDPEMHLILGIVLQRQNRRGEAEAAFRKALFLQPTLSGAHNNLAVILHSQKKFEEAEAAFRKAIALQPSSSMTYCNLGTVLLDQKKFEEAEAAFRKAIALQPDLATTYYDLGVVLCSRNKFEEAEAAFRKAIALQPDDAAAHINLGLLLGQQARFEEAVTGLKKARGLLDDGSPRRQQVEQALLHYQRQASLEARLPGILNGTDQPASVAEQLELARLCLLREYPAASVRLSRAAFADPNLARAVPLAARYYAACAAALAGCGQGKDADGLDDTERAGLRQQAHDWLRANLSWWSKLLDKADARTKAMLAQQMQHWGSDTALAGVRDKANLAQLPEAERIAWQNLWDDVSALQRRAAAR